MLEHIDFTNSEQRQQALYVASIFERGVDEGKVIGYHGTSIEALSLLIRQGFLPGSKIDDLYPQGPVFLLPL